MIDMHAHILPCADHGSQSVGMSLTLVDAAISAGIDTIVATPHFYLNSADSLHRMLKRREEGLAALSGAMSSEQKAKCRILSGSEVNLRLGLSGFDLKELCIEGTDVMLLEMPTDVKWGSWVYNEISAIMEQQHIRPLIAHIDRYPEAQIRELFEYFPLYAQINAEAIASVFSRKRILRYFKAGIVWAIGSDVHRSASSYAVFQKCQKYIGDYLAQTQRRSELLIGGK